MTRGSTARLALLAGLLGVVATAQAEGPAELPAEVEARTLKVAEAELGRIERVLKAQPGVAAASIANVTLPLQAALEEDLGKGPVKLYPRATLEACLAALKKGQDRDKIGLELVELHRRGELAKAAPAAPAPAADASVKRVASFVFDKERVRSPDPHLPPTVKAAPGEKLKGLYQICVGTDGKVTKVTTVQSIPGADQAVIEQLQGTWQYKPQPVPVCTTRAFVFQFN